MQPNLPIMGPDAGLGGLLGVARKSVIPDKIISRVIGTMNVVVLKGKRFVDIG